jgi:hypothetical protein
VGGYATIEAGGAAAAMLIASRGRAFVYGTASATIVNSGGGQFV